MTEQGNRAVERLSRIEDEMNSHCGEDSDFEALDETWAKVWALTFDLMGISNGRERTDIIHSLYNRRGYQGTNLQNAYAIGDYETYEHTYDSPKEEPSDETAQV